MAIDFPSMLPTQKFFLADYKFMLKKLLPIGHLWRSINTTFDLLLEAIAVEFGRLEGRYVDLIRESVPYFSSELLPDWEASLLLLSEKPGPSDTTAQRQAAVQAKLLAYCPGSNFAFFQQLAATFGMTIHQGTPAAPFVIGVNVIGDALGPPGGLYNFIIVVDTDPNSNLAKFQTAVLRYLPAHVQVSYQ